MGFRVRALAYGANITGAIEALEPRAPPPPRGEELVAAPVLSPCASLAGAESCAGGLAGAADDVPQAAPPVRPLLRHARGQMRLPPVRAMRRRASQLPVPSPMHPKFIRAEQL